MTDDYLWDRSGDVDPDVARLEQLLGPLGHPSRHSVPEAGRLTARVPVWRKLGIPLALAASVVLLVGQTWLGSRLTPDTWIIERHPGMAATGSRRLERRSLAIGEWVQTARAGRAVVRAAGIGAVDIGPDSLVRVVAAGPGRHVLHLERGALVVDVSAAPGVFSVTTAAARAVDLGCRYTLDVDGTGEGFLHVTLGWVGLRHQGRESLVPAGAVCATRAASGPGTPYFEDATPAFVSALHRLDASADPGDGAALTALLSEARPVDAITLWHLLTRLDTTAVSRVYDRLAVLAPPTSAVSLEQALAGNAVALASWWEDLGLGDIAVLRQGMARFR